MTGDDEQPDPNKTIFRPSPLQGLRGDQGASRPGGTQFTPGNAAPSPPLPDPFGQAQAAPQPPSSTPAPRAASDDDIPKAPPGERPRSIMVAAAAPLLALIAGVRSGRVQMPLAELHTKASAAAVQYDQALDGAGYDFETRQRARYGVYATVDDIAQNLPGQAADGAEWARRSLVVQAFSENIGGDRFWQLLETMLARPAEHLELIELYHACLAAGFEGRYRVTNDGKSRLHDIMTGAYSALQHVRGLSQTEISPRWRGLPTPMGKVGFWTILALIGAGALTLLLIVFLALRLTLMQTGQPSLRAIRAINPDQPLRLSRVAPAPPPTSDAQLKRVQGFLAPEIAAHLVVVEEDATSLRVRTTIGQLFKSGSDALEPGKQGLFERIGSAIQAEKGSVKIEGHANSDRVATLAFPDNVALSKARAETVAKIIKSKLTDQSRVTSDGFGDSQPIASNAAPEGKSLNRRVEIVVPRIE